MHQSTDGYQLLGTDCVMYAGRGVLIHHVDYRVWLALTNAKYSERGNGQKQGYLGVSMQICPNSPMGTVVTFLKWVSLISMSEKCSLFPQNVVVFE